MEAKFIDIKEFRELGFLQEINRLFLHPMGMALEIKIDAVGNESLSGIWDYRDDPEGVLYEDGLCELQKFKENAKYVRDHRIKMSDQRFELLGYVYQPVEII